MTLGTATVLHEKRPPWAFAGADLDLDFANGRGWVAPGRKSLRDLLSVTRASVGYAEYQSGVWLPSASGVARITDKGLLVEEARTNSIRNNSMQGASAPSTLPTNWNSPFTGGLTRTIVGVGTENGVDYIDMRFSGTSNSTSVQIYFGTTTDISASNGQAWAHSAFVSLVDGTFDDVSSALFFINQRDGGGAFISNVYGSSFISSITSTQLRFSDVITTNSASIAYFLPGIFLGITNGAAIDFTLRIGWPQAEEGAFATSPIRTTTAAATRAADLITVTDFGWYNAVEGSLYIEGQALDTAVATTSVFQIDDGGTTNRIIATIDGTGQPSGGLVIASNTTTFNVTANAASGINKIALGYKANDAAASINGSAPSTDTSVTVPTVTVARLGSNTISYWSGYLRRAAYFPTRLTNAQLAALTT